MQPDDPIDNEADETPKAERRVSRWVIFGSVSSAVLSLATVGTVLAGFLALFYPDSPLPPEWNPAVQLDVAHQVTSLTTSKLRMALSDAEQCRAVLARAAQVSFMSSLGTLEHCHIRNWIALSAVGSARTNGVETSCATALRLAMWEHHGVQPAARAILATQATVFRQNGSYNCRPIRTTRGVSDREHPFHG